MESLENKKYYKWISGPDQNTVEVYLAEDETGRIWFESGNSVLKDSIDSVMLESTESEYTYSQSMTKKVEDVYSQYEKLLNDPISVEIENKPVEKEKSAVKIIIEKQKKLKDIELDLKIPVKLPNEKAIEFMTVMFDEDEVIEEITDFVKSQVTNEVIIEMIKNSIKLRVSLCASQGDE